MHLEAPGRRAPRRSTSRARSLSRRPRRRRPRSVVAARLGEQLLGGRCRERRRASSPGTPPSSPKVAMPTQRERARADPWSSTVDPSSPRDQSLVLGGVRSMHDLVVGRRRTALGQRERVERRRRRPSWRPMVGARCPSVADDRAVGLHELGEALDRGPAAAATPSTAADRRRRPRRRHGPARVAVLAVDGAVAAGRPRRCRRCRRRTGCRTSCPWCRSAPACRP